MKTYVIVGSFVIAVLAMSTSVSAQPVAAGVKVGVVSSTLTGATTGATSKAMQLGLSGGAFVTVGLGGIAIQPEAIVSQEGVEVTYPGKQVGNFRVTMLHIPVLLRFGSKLYALVGPDIGLVLKAKAQFDGQPDQDFKNEVKKQTLSLVVGAGARVSRFLVEARYSAGVSDTNRTSLPEGKNRLNVASVMIGLQF